MQNGFESQILIEPVARLMEEFSRLPGIGPKTASRLVFFLLRAPDEQAHALAEALANLKDNVRFCSRCFNITVERPVPDLLQLDPRPTPDLRGRGAAGRAGDRANLALARRLPRAAWPNRAARRHEPRGHPLR